MAWEWLGPVATGVVGIAGIVGSVWTAASARRSQAESLRSQSNAESRQAFRADKQALYTRVLHELTTFVETSVRRKALTAAKATTDEELDELRSVVDAHSKQMLVVGRLRAEVAVVAGPALADEVRRVAVKLIAISDGKGDVDGAPDVLAELIEAMHADLKVDV
ncbi:hypothetical protein ACH4T9_07300 [Micromonospora sp. NPDC020750]|uniref:hypothetical protein n=1 Tax=unclassified Micromonospora TaxID=2617518 RepID=UPI0037A5C984